MAEDYPTFREWVRCAEQRIREEGSDPETVRVRWIQWDPMNPPLLADIYPMFWDRETDEVIAALENRTSDLIVLSED